ncbi:MAG: hypothetical protein VKJ06_06860 [Vampirovibrionales bacterium]|nr:hypothetical protein [Vampirovibrionales bacterium]
MSIQALNAGYNGYLQQQAVLNSAPKVSQQSSGAPVVAERYQNSVKKWGAREALANLGNRFFGANGLDDLVNGWTTGLVTDKTLQTANMTRQNAASYAELLNLGQNGVSASQWMQADVRQAVRAANWQNAFNTQTWQTLKTNPGHVLKQRVYGNIAPAAEALATGKNWAGGAMNVLGLGMLGYSIADGTRKGYLYAKSQEDGSARSRLRTAATTLNSFVGQGLKSIVSWEAGSIGFALTKATLGLGGLPGVLAGVAGGGVFSALSYVGLSKVIPEPPEVPKKP